MQRPELPRELRSSAMKVFREFVVLNFERASRDVAIDATPALMRIQSCKIEAASTFFTRAVLVYTLLLWKRRNAKLGRACEQDSAQLVEPVSRAQKIGAEASFG
jgi:hypothetical protein